MFIRYPPAKIRYEADQPVALLGVRTAPSYRLVDLPLGPPTTSARSERGTWALFALGEEVVVVHPDGAISGPPADAAAEVGRLSTQESQGELDRQAARTIRQLLLGDGADQAGPAHRSGDRAWSIPPTAAWPALIPQATSRPGAACVLSTPPPRHPQAAAHHPSQPRRQDDMRITATCSNCRHDLLLSQLVEGPGISGRCPWCGTMLAPHYTQLLADTIRRAEHAGTELERALERLGENWARLHVRSESVLDPLRAQLLGAEAALHHLGERRAA